MNPRPKPSTLRTGPGLARIYYLLEVWVTFGVLYVYIMDGACSIEVHVSRWKF
jgi:hypothetical protein